MIEIHKSQTSDEFWDSIKDEIIHMYADERMSTNKIGEKYGCWDTTIQYKLKEWGVPKNTRPNSLYTLNENYFEIIDNEHKAYWYGFLLADGHVNESVIMLTLKKEDEYIIEEYKHDLEAGAPLSYDKYGNAGLNIACKKMCNDLITKGFHHRKSDYLDIDKVVSYVPSNLEHHFIRGMFDGDGCVGLYNYAYLSKPQCHFGYTGLENVCKYVGDKLNIHTKMQDESELIKTIKTRDNVLISNIMDYLYKDATIYLDRKYTKFRYIKLITFNDYNGNIPKVG